MAAVSAETLRSAILGLAAGALTASLLLAWQPTSSTSLALAPSPVATVAATGQQFQAMPVLTVGPGVQQAPVGAISTGTATSSTRQPLNQSGRVIAVVGGALALAAAILVRLAWRSTAGMLLQPIIVTEPQMALMGVTGQRLEGANAAPSAHGPTSSTALAMGKGPFGWLENNKDVAGRDKMFEEQQRILQARKAGTNLDAAKARREKVSKFTRGQLPKEEMDAIKRRNEEKAKALSKEAVKGGIPLPMASFGMPEFDGGERFDLKGPYVDEGWVDPNDKGPFDWLPWNKKKDEGK